MSKLTIIDYVNKRVNEQYDFLKEQNERIQNMYSDFNDLLEYKKVIEVSKEMLQTDEFYQMRHRLDSISEGRPSHSQNFDPEGSRMLMNDSFISEGSADVVIGSGVKVGRVVGTCMNEDLLKLKRLLFRATRGNALVISKNEGDIETFDHKKIPKSIFIIVFQEGAMLRNKIETIANNFSKNRYKLPKTDLNIKLDKITERVNQTRELIVLTIAGLQKYLES